MARPGHHPQAVRRARGARRGLCTVAFALAAHAGELHAGAPVVTDVMVPFTGGFEEMVERRRIRALVPYSKTFYFLDGPTPRGLSYEMLKAFEQHVNEVLGKSRLRIHVTVVPVRRDQLIPFLLEGRGDLAVGNLTITPERSALVEFSEPTLTGVDEIVVTGPGVPHPDTVEDLSGMTVHVRRSSSYFASLMALNERLITAGREPVRLRIADEALEDEDLLEMMNAGLVPTLVVDSHKAEFWADVLPQITLHRDVAVRTGGSIAWAMRPGDAQLKEVVDGFIREHRKGTLVGNMLFRRYLETNRWIKNPLSRRAMERFRGVLEEFRLYAERYGFDPLLLAALAYQESGLDHSKRSPDGAVGIMQILPSTAADPNVEVTDIEQRRNNIHAGVKYLRFLVDRYFDEPDLDPLNRTLLAFAAYNAGPRRVAELRREAQEKGLDHDVWFDNVERVAASQIGRETVRYVSNIYKYYIAYRLVTERLAEKSSARSEAGVVAGQP